MIAKTLGEQQSEKANNFFSAHYFYCDYRYVMSALGLMIMRPIAIIMGATGDLLDKSVLHYDFLPNGTHATDCISKSITCGGKTQNGAYTNFNDGGIDMLFNALFIIVFRWVIVGTADFSVIEQLIGSIVPLVYFSRKKNIYA